MTTALPESIAIEMKLWRGGLGDFPVTYIEFHRDLAEKTLPALAAEHGLVVHNSYMERDGWGDAMMVLHAVVEERGGRLVKLRWNDSARMFFECGAGSWPYRPKH